MTFGKVGHARLSHHVGDGLRLLGFAVPHKRSKLGKVGTHGVFDKQILRILRHCSKVVTVQIVAVLLDFFTPQAVLALVQPLCACQYAQ